MLKTYNNKKKTSRDIIRNIKIKYLTTILYVRHVSNQSKIISLVYVFQNTSFFFLNTLDIKTSYYEMFQILLNINIIIYLK